MSIKNRVTVICATCNKPVEKQKSKLRYSRSGMYFCNRLCKEKAQSIGGIKAIMPKHYNDGNASYRKRALKHYPNECSVCGYNVVEVLEVHHKDGNRKNSALENLDILCPTHHVEYECGIRKYE